MFDFNSTLYKEYLKDFRENPSKKRIIVFAGKFTENRKFALSQFKAEAIGEVKEIDLSKYITGFEDESYAKIDNLFNELTSDNSLIIFNNAEQLCGVYVGHSYSVVKYATPQEKYFLNKLSELNCSSILEFNNEQHLDKAMERVADALIHFPVPSSKLEKLFFWLTQVRVNGSNLPSQRPV